MIEEVARWRALSSRKVEGTTDTSLANRCPEYVHSLHDTLDPMYTVYVYHVESTYEHHLYISL